MANRMGFIVVLALVILVTGAFSMYQVAEWVKGSPLTDRAQIIGQQIGILALLLLMSFAFYNDIARILG